MDDEVTNNEIKVTNPEKRFTEKGSDNIINFDDVLPHAGEFGLYQVYLFMMTIPFYFYLAFVYNSQQIITESSDKYWCSVPQLKNMTLRDRMSIAIPPDNSSRNGYSACSMYQANWSNVLETGARPQLGWRTIPCQDGWEFDMSEIPYPTITSELGWVCDKNSYQATAQSIFFSGSIVGGFLIGSIADHYGRLPALILSNVFGFLGGISTSFVQNFAQFAICRFIVGLGYDNVCTMMYILVLEYTAPKYRSVMANISFAVNYCIATSLLPWIAIACGHWRIFALVTSLPMSLAVLTYFVLPESPRWLLSMGKIEHTINILKRMAKVNKHSIADSVIENFRKSAASTETTKREINLLQLKNRPIVLRILLLQAIIFMCTEVVFDALVRMAGKIGYNFALSFTLLSLTEFPSLLLLIFILDRCGRRCVFLGSMLISALFTSLAAAVEHGLPSVCCCVVARFFINMGYSTALQWAPESLPTEIRASGVAFIHISAYVAVMVSPFIVYLETIYTWLPLAVIAVVAVSGAGISLLLPETCGKPLPQTIEDSEELLRNHSVWNFCFPRNEEKFYPK